MNQKQSAEAAKLLAALEDLKSDSPQLRITASKCLLSAGLREYSGLRKEILSSDKSWDALLKALSDKEPKVVENAAGAITQTIGRYRRDNSSFEPLCTLLTNKNKMVRMFAVRGLGYLDRPDSLNMLVPLLSDKTEQVRRAVVLVLGRRAKELSPADRLKAKESMQQILLKAGPEMKIITEAAVQCLSSVNT